MLIMADNQMSTTEAKRTVNGEIEDLDVIVVGARFAGLYLLDRLRSMGMAVQVFEARAALAASGIGIVILGPASILLAQSINTRATTCGGNGSSANSIRRGRKSASISATLTKNSASVGTFASTDA
jgi:2-polyprenyl-6-methoxyphenol hydroxylase-like FAD-dependent oxidoreductase